jgi:hypothetical protein
MSSNANVVQLAEQKTIQSSNGGSTPTHSLQSPEVQLELVSRSDTRYAAIRKNHYVDNRGCIGQQAHFIIHHRDKVVGIISAASPVYATSVRDGFFGITKTNRHQILNGIVNNSVFRLETTQKNLATQVLKIWRTVVPHYWYQTYGTVVYGFETFVVEEGDRNGAIYRGDNWTLAGRTAGSSKLRSGIDKPANNWKSVEPKLVYCRWREGFNSTNFSRTPAWVRTLFPVGLDQFNDAAWSNDKITRRRNRKYLNKGD